MGEAPRWVIGNTLRYIKGRASTAYRGIQYTALPGANLKGGPGHERRRFESGRVEIAQVSFVVAWRLRYH